MVYNVIRVAVVAILLTAGAAFAQKLFREAAAATPYSTFSNRSFSINGKPTWVFAGEVEYWRIPKELWRDRLMRVKRAGYNTVSFYVFWNLHEPVQGQFHYEDNLDLDAWLTLIKELGLYAIPRVGPYDCAEIDFGGFAPWLVDVPNMRIRGTDAQYLQRVDAYFESIFPIISKHQINRGGPVTVIQIENEHYPAGGAYQTHLADKAKALGMVVPYIWSDIYNATTYDPGAFPELGVKGFSTEQWMGWISRYGEPSANDANSYNNQTWRMLACGSGGTSHYMAHGGTNFGYTASPDQRITSYDYGSQIGELGQIRPVYYSVKQCGWLATTFNPLFASSTNGASLVTGLPTTGVASYVQTGTGGKAAMVTNGASTFRMTWTNKGITLPTVGSWSLQSGNCAYFLADVPITDNCMLDYSATGILCRKKLGTKNFIVLYGTPNNTGGDIAFVYTTAPATAPVSPWSWDAAAKRATLRFTYPTTDTVNEIVLSEGAGQTINLLVMNNSLSNKTWITDSSIVCGAEYVDHNENLHFAAAGGRAFVFSGGAMQRVVQAASSGQTAKSFASGWSWIASPEVGESYNDATWKSSPAAQNMTYYGWPNGYGWYRTTHTANSAGNATLSIPGISGTVGIYVNGTWAGTSTSQSITLKQGANTIAILANGIMRDKMYNTFNYTVPDKCRTGIWGAITIGGAAVGPWRFRGGFEGVDESPMMGTISSASWNALLARTWSTAAAPADRIPRLWRMDFAYTPPANGVQTWTLNGTVTAGTQGVVWFNGRCLGRQITNQPALYVPECWLKANNTVIVMTQEGGAPQGYSLQPVEYRSFAKSPLVGVGHDNAADRSSLRQMNGASPLVVTGNTVAFPSRLRGKDGFVAIYDLRGHLLHRVMVKAGTPPHLPQGKAIPRGVYIVRMER